MSDEELLQKTIAARREVHRSPFEPGRKLPASFQDLAWKYFALDDECKRRGIEVPR